MSVRMTVAGRDDLRFLAEHFRQSQVAILERLIADEARRVRAESPPPRKARR